MLMGSFAYLRTSNFKRASYYGSIIVCRIPLYWGSQKSKHELQCKSDAHFLNHNLFLMLTAVLSSNPTNSYHNKNFQTEDKNFFCSHDPAKRRISNMNNTVMLAQGGYSTSSETRTRSSVGQRLWKEWPSQKGEGHAPQNQLKNKGLQTANRNIWVSTELCVSVMQCKQRDRLPSVPSSTMLTFLY